MLQVNGLFPAHLRNPMDIDSMSVKNMSQRLVLTSGYYPQGGLAIIKNNHLICLFNTASNRVIQGKASVLRPRSAATISDSAV